MPKVSSTLRRAISPMDTDEDFGGGYINEGKYGVLPHSSAMFAKKIYRKNPVGFVKKIEYEIFFKKYSIIGEILKRCAHPASAWSPALLPCDADKGW